MQGGSGYVVSRYMTNRIQIFKQIFFPIYVKFLNPIIIKPPLQYVQVLGTDGVFEVHLFSNMQHKPNQRNFLKNIDVILRFFSCMHNLKTNSNSVG